MLDGGKVCQGDRWRIARRDTALLGICDVAARICITIISSEFKSFSPLCSPTLLLSQRNSPEHLLCAGCHFGAENNSKGAKHNP